MPNPKRRHSKARGRNRRGHWKAVKTQLITCPQCKEPKMPHCVCVACGFYDGRLVIDFAGEKAKKEAKKKKNKK
jgi:large subunit ribosomal protein L32